MLKKNKSNNSIWNAMYKWWQEEDFANVITKLDYWQVARLNFWIFFNMERGLFFYIQVGMFCYDPASIYEVCKKMDIEDLRKELRKYGAYTNY